MPSAKLAGRSWLAPAIVLAVAASFAGIGSHSLWTPDEPRDAAVGKAMWESGDRAVPRLNGQPFLEKPPLYWWVQAAGFAALGVGDAQARVPSALFATLALVLTYAMGRRLGGSWVGFVAAGVLATTAEFAEDMSRVVVDPPLVLFVAAAWFGFAVLEEARSAAERRWAYGAVAIAIPLAFLAKGVVGIGLGLGPPLLYLLVLGGRRPRREALRSLLPLAALGVPLVAALVLPWALGVVREAGWPALRECLVGNTVGRLLSTEAGRAYGHRQPAWYYLTAGLPAILPWVVALPAMVRAGTWRRRAAGSEGQGAQVGHVGEAELVGQSADAVRLLLACCGLAVLLLSAAASKRALYLVPALPAFAVRVACWLERASAYGSDSAHGSESDHASDRAAAGEGRSWDRPTLLVLLGLGAALLTLGGLALAFVDSIPWARLGAMMRLPFDVRLARVAIPGVLRVVFAIGALALGLVSIARWREHLRRRTRPGAGWLIAQYFVLFLGLQTVVKAAIEPLKNLHDLTAAIARLDPGAAPVTAYQPTETLFGIVGFDLDRRVAPLTRPEEIARFFALRPGGRLVLTVQALGRLPPALGLHLRLLYDESGYKASPYAVVTWSGEETKERR